MNLLIEESPFQVLPSLAMQVGLNEAMVLQQDMFRETPKRLTHASHLMPKLFRFDETGAANILYFHRNKVVAYPYYLGHAGAGERCWSS